MSKSPHKKVNTPIYDGESNLNSLKTLNYLTSGVLKSASHIGVCCALLSMRNSSTGALFPTVKKIALCSSLTRKSTVNILKELVESGIIIREPRILNNEKQSSLYFFSFDFEFLYRMSIDQQDNWESPFHSDFDWPETIEKVYYKHFN